MSDGEVAYYSDDFEEEDEERRLSPVKQSRGRPPSRLNLAPHLSESPWESSPPPSRQINDRGASTPLGHPWRPWEGPSTRGSLSLRRLNTATSECPSERPDTGYYSTGDFYSPPPTCGTPGSTNPFEETYIALEAMGMQPIPKTPPPQDGADEDGTIAVGFPYMGGFGGGQAIDPAEMPSPAGLGDSMRFTGSQCVLHHPPPPSPAARLVEKGRSEGPRRTRDAADRNNDSRGLYRDESDDGDRYDTDDSRSQYSPDPSVRHLRRPRTSSLSSLAADTTGRLDLGDSSPVGGSTVSIPALDTLARSLSQRSSLMDGDGDERVSTSHDDTGEPAAPEPSTSPRLGQREDRFRAEQEEPSERASLSQSYAGSSSATMPMLLQQMGSIATGFDALHSSIGPRFGFGAFPGAPGPPVYISPAKPRVTPGAPHVGCPVLSQRVPKTQGHTGHRAPAGARPPGKLGRK